MTEENKINFWEINLNNEQKTDSENFLKNKKLEQEKSIIAKANEEKNKPFENTINLDDIKETGRLLALFGSGLKRSFLKIQSEDEGEKACI